LLARYEEIELLVRIGEYQPGSDKLADEAVVKIDAIRGFLRERAEESTPFETMRRRLRGLVG
jgi:type III secretion protein N (ATPase)